MRMIRDKAQVYLNNQIANWIRFKEWKLLLHVLQEVKCFKENTLLWIVIKEWMRSKNDRLCIIFEIDDNQMYNPSGIFPFFKYRIFSLAFLKSS